MWRLPIKALIILLLISLISACSNNETATPEPSPPPTESTPAIANLPDADGLRIVLAYGGNIYLLDANDDAPLQIYAGDGTEIAQVHLSPDAEAIAFQTLSSGTLNIISNTGDLLVQLETTPIIQQMAWSDAQTLYLNTAEQTTLGLTPRNDLYRFDLAENLLEEVEPGGGLSISPDGETVLVIHPGVIDSIGGKITRAGDESLLLEFPAVATGTHSGYYPSIHWANNDRIYVAIPDTNAFYTEFETESEPVQVYEIDLNADTSQVVTTVQASVYGLPQVSPDGEAMVFLRRADTPELVNIMVMGINNETEAEIYASTTLDSLIAPIWLPDGQRFLYGHDGVYWIGQIGEEPQRWIDLSGNILAAPSIAGDFAVFTRIISITDTIELRYADLNNETGASGLVAEITGQFLTFDAVILPE